MIALNLRFFLGFFSYFALLTLLILGPPLACIFRWGGVQSLFDKIDNLHDEKDEDGEKTEENSTTLAVLEGTNAIAVCHIWINL